MARTLGVLFLSGAALALSGVVFLTLPSETNMPASVGLVAGALCVGMLLMAARDRLSQLAIQGLLGLASVCVTLSIHFSGDPATANSMFYAWVAVYSGLFLSRRAAAVQLGVVGLAYGVELLVNQPGGSAVVHWLIAMGALGVMEGLVAGLTARVRRGALYDPVARLPRREILMERLQQLLGRNSEGEALRVAVAFVSIDRFDLVSQSVEPRTRDRLVALAAARLTSSLGPRDGVAYCGGGNFVVLLDGEGGALRATRAAERISERLGALFHLDGHELSLSVSIGLAFDGGETSSASELLRTAETAVERTGSRGPLGNPFDDGTADRAAKQLELASDLQRAVERDEFEIHYQPKVSLHTGRVLGTEALVRWRHPRRGLVQPADFIPCAEDTGAIVPLGRTVLRRACMQARAWQTRFPAEPPLKVFVNVSSRQLQDDQLVRDVAESLERSAIEPGSLALELTESAVAEDPEHTAATLRRLKGLGVTLAVDDFGVGYSSLGLLRKLPVDELKIDRSFVARMLDGPEDEAIVAAVLSLARALGLEVVAEGVERSDQLERLRELGCDVAQGFLFARPLPALEATRAISARA